ncbi:NADH:flavin oxidoreductase/NADH oxidase [Tistrella mobilis]|uniref:NADH:flavin oxidoreductase/NADH oxidase n=1 Tax=Tistrella mobilis TaxID=171437 RepID=UPI003557EE63
MSDKPAASAPASVPASTPVPSAIPAPGRDPQLFKPIGFRSVTARNRIMIAPMCQYSVPDGLVGDWHLAHLGGFAKGGAGIVFAEATGVLPEGRITPWCPGLWSDAQEAAFARVVDFVAGQGAVPAIQLAHAGRKASTDAPWRGGGLLAPDQGGWQPVGPTDAAFSPAHAVPTALTEDGIRHIADAFAASAARARRAGFRIIEVHGAHGYLLHSFLSPLSNTRDDAFGGDADRRMAALMLVLDAVRSEWPAELPLFLRLSCSDWVEGGLDIAASVEIAKRVKARGDVDLIDCSSGGGDPRQKLRAYPGYQVPFAEAIRREAGIATAAVGLITQPEHAEEIIANGRADLVALARVTLGDPHWPLRAAKALGAELPWPDQYSRGILQL